MDTAATITYTKATQYHNLESICKTNSLSCVYRHYQVATNIIGSLVYTRVRSETYT